MDIATLNDIKVNGKKVLVRVDFNVPMDETTGRITDDGRIRAALPTINYLLEAGARIILCSHLGRPKGQVDEEQRLGGVATRLLEILGRPVTAAKEAIGPEVEQAVARMKNRDILMLENIRFYGGEEKNDDKLAQGLAKLAEIYVDDAFGTTHRAHASIVAITRYLPAVAGLLLEKELETLGGLLDNPVRPFASLLGGAKVSDKVAMLNNIMHKVDFLLIGGGMAATFLKARGYEVGQSLVEMDMLGTAISLMEKASQNGTKFVFPTDVVVADTMTESAACVKAVHIKQVPPELKIVDIGPRTIQDFSAKLKECRTIFWNGPMGVYEIPRFATGTRELATVLAESGATTIVGGGSTAEATAEMGLENKMTFVSTGGGASLSFMSGEPMPGVQALLKKNAIPENLKK